MVRVWHHYRGCYVPVSTTAHNLGGKEVLTMPTNTQGSEQALPNPNEVMDVEQLLHLFVIFDLHEKYVRPLYAGVVPHSKVSNTAIEWAHGDDFATRVYDVEAFTEQEAREDLKSRLSINPRDEDFYPLVYPDGPIGELQQIFGLRPEYTPADYPFDQLIKWRDAHIAQQNAALLRDILGYGQSCWTDTTGDYPGRRVWAIPASILEAKAEELEKQL